MSQDVFYQMLFKRMADSGGRFIISIDDGNLEPVRGPGWKDDVDLMRFHQRFAKAQAAKQRNGR